MAQTASVPIRYGWPMGIRGHRQILLPLCLQEDLPGPQVPLAPQVPPDHKDLLEQRGLPELQAHRGPQELPEHKDLLALKGPQVPRGQPEPTGSTESPF